MPAFPGDESEKSESDGMSRGKSTTTDGLANVCRGMKRQLYRFVGTSLSAAAKAVAKDPISARMTATDPVA
jgi:hypothetical protein